MVSSIPSWTSPEPKPALSLALHVRRKKRLTELVAEGNIKSNSLWRQQGGIECIEQGLKLLKAGKVRLQLGEVRIGSGLLTRLLEQNSGQKLTYRL